MRLSVRAASRHSTAAAKPATMNNDKSRSEHRVQFIPTKANAMVEKVTVMSARQHRRAGSPYTR
jgi:hypothetical protein